MRSIVPLLLACCLPLNACGQHQDGSAAPAVTPAGTAAPSVAAPSVNLRFAQAQRLPKPAGKLPDNVSPNIVIDQMGYLPDAPKVAILRDPQRGHDAGRSYGIDGKQYQLVDLRSGERIDLPAPKPWHSGNPVDADSGDRGWWLDFSAVSKPGYYYISEGPAEGAARSHPFVIDSQAYRPALRAALRAFYYNRHGVDKLARWSDETLAGTRPWIDADSGKPFETAQDISNKVAATARDLSGGWADAGDSNKYVTFAFEPVHVLLSAYDLMPTAFEAARGGDDFDIPESGNGIPDLLDEVKWEIDWLKRMCDANGACILKTGYSKFEDELNLSKAKLLPSQNHAKRYWSGYDCSAGNIAAASMFAHAAATFRRSGGKLAADQAYLDDLQARAVAGFKRFEQQRKRVAGPRPYTNDCDIDLYKNDGTTVKVGDADGPFYNSDSLQQSMAVTTAIFLHELAEGPKSGPFNDYIDAYVGQMKAMQENFFVLRASDTVVLLYYSRLPGASAATQQRVRQKMVDFLKSGGGFNLGGTDTSSLYRNRIKDFVYGSNGERMGNAIANLMPRIDGGFPMSKDSQYADRALEALHYIHGANPFNVAFLTNMSGPPYYLERSVRQMYHYWAINGSDRFDEYRPEDIVHSPGPMPGYFMPGASADTRFFDGEGAIQCTRLQALASRCPSPPFAAPDNRDIGAQPREKRWAEINNTNYPGDFWYIASEPFLIMQAQYLFVAAAFANPP